MTDQIEIREFSAVEVQGSEQVQILDAAATETQEVLFVEVGTGGPQGVAGPQGPTGAAGAPNLFIQPTAPVTSLDQYQWWETTADEGDLVTLWVET